MKNRKISWAFLGAALGIFAAASIAEAQKVNSITPGYYTDKNGHELFIKPVSENGATNYYGAIIWKKGFLSVYKIQDLNGESQNWINLYQQEDHRLSTNSLLQPTYSVRPEQKGGKLNLNFELTDYARNIGRNVPCSITPAFVYRGDSKKWSDFSQIKSGTYQGVRARVKPISDSDKRLKKQTELIISSYDNNTSWSIVATNMILETLNYKEWVNPAIGRTQYPEQTIYSGEYIGTELFPGLMITKKIDQTTAEGVLLDEEISMFAIPVSSNGRVDTIQVFRMAPEDVECAYVRNQLKPAN